MEGIESNLNSIRSVMIDACRKANRPLDSVKILAATKSQSVDRINTYLSITKNNRLIGESYVQEFKEKFHAINHPCEKHFIGNLQSNKASTAVEIFDVIQSVSSSKLANVLNREAKKKCKLQRIFLQVNISNDLRKGGFTTDQLRQFIVDSVQLDSLKIEGLMTITADYPNAEDVRGDYKAMRVLRDELLGSSYELSMGMSGDFGIAIEEGATIIRIGTLLFGLRKNSHEDCFTDLSS